MGVTPEESRTGSGQDSILAGLPTAPGWRSHGTKAVTPDIYSLRLVDGVVTRLTLG